VRPIPLTRIRLRDSGVNVCGVSAQTFAVRGAVVPGDQLAGVVDHLTLLDGGIVLVERDGRVELLGPLGPMTPRDDLRAELLTVDYIAERDGVTPPPCVDPAEPTLIAEPSATLVEPAPGGPAVVAPIKRGPGRPRKMPTNG
jgi:hypothetical protein